MGSADRSPTARPYQPATAFDSPTRLARTRAHALPEWKCGHAGVVDLDPGIADRADGDWQGEAVQQRKVDVDIEPLRLEAGKAIGDGLETLADGIEMVQSFLRRKSARLLETSSLRRKVANFSYCLRKAFLK